MHCASCVQVNESTLKQLEGVDEINVNIATSIANIEFDESKVSLDEIKNIIIQNWFSSELYDSSKSNIEDDSERVTWKAWMRFVVSAIFSLPVFWMMFFEDFMIWVSYFWVDLMMLIYSLLSFLVVFVFWFHFHDRAFKSLMRFRFNMDSLVSLWTLVAFFYSFFAMFAGFPVYFEAAVSIITLINLWKYLEAKSKWRASSAIAKLIEIWAKKAVILENWIEKEVDTDLVKVWQIIIVKPWEKIALDWKVIFWHSNVDESALTWESMPVSKREWDEVFWATMNQNWVLKIEVSKEWKDTVFSQVIKMVENAQNTKAPIQKLADQISWIFVPVIIIISIITFLVWYFTVWDLTLSIISAVSVLVIACPCALGLATPTAIMVWTWAWAQNWILIKSWETLEKSNDIDTVVFDKTWTLTVWKPSVTDIECFDIWEKQLLIIAWSLALQSNHPLSKSISNYCPDKNEVENFLELEWRWVSWEVDWKIYLLWNGKLMEEKDVLISHDVRWKFDNLSSQWKTAIYIAKDSIIIWLIALSDTLKEDAIEAIDRLKEIGIESILLTWDNRLVAENIWAKLWITKIISEVLPNEKAEKIKEIQALWKKVAFVWDWINDAPALVQADLWIAIWTWSDIAVETWDIVLVHWTPSKVVTSIKLAQKTFKIIKQNLFWAFIYNVIWIPLAAFWFLSPIFASAAMSASSVSVVTNSLRLRKFKG